MKKQFFRVKQLADQTFSRAGKTEALSDDLQDVEKRVEFIKAACFTAGKKLAGATTSHDTHSREKRLKKSPEYNLAFSMLELSAGEDDDLLKQVITHCGKLQMCLANAIVEHEMKVESNIVMPLMNVCDVDYPNIMKQKRNLTKLILDMDSLRARYNTASKHGGSTPTSKIKDELEEAEGKVEQARETLACDMLQLIAREADLSNVIVEYAKLQKNYHEAAFKILEEIIPEMETSIKYSRLGPVFGRPLEEHLKVTGRKVAFPIELCVCGLLELGIAEEGIFRVTPGASKVRRMKVSLDANCMDLEAALQFRDPHIFAGVLKSYLRELPEPLLTHALYDQWIAAAKLLLNGNNKDGMQSLKSTLLSLPQANLENLKYLIKFLSSLASNKHTNKMTPQNLAIVVSPSLIWSPNEDTSSIGINMNSANLHSIIVENLVCYCDRFFPEECDFYLTLSQDVGMMNGHSVFTESNTAESMHQSQEGNIKRTQSNSSLSDHNSSPPQGSPKPAVRVRKHKPAAPHPPGHRDSQVQLDDKTKERRPLSSAVDNREEVGRTSSGGSGEERPRHKVSGENSSLGQPHDSHPAEAKPDKQKESKEEKNAKFKENLQQQQVLPNPNEDKVLVVNLQENSKGEDSGSGIEVENSQVVAEKSDKITSEKVTEKLLKTESTTSTCDLDRRNSKSGEDLHKMKTYELYSTLERKKPPRPMPRTSLVIESMQGGCQRDGEEGGGGVKKPAVPERPANLQRPHSSSFRVPRNFDTDLTQDSMIEGRNICLERTHIYSVDKHQVSLPNMSNDKADQKQERERKESVDKPEKPRKPEMIMTHGGGHQRAASEGSIIDTGLPPESPRTLTRPPRPTPPPPPPVAAAAAAAAAGSGSSPGVSVPPGTTVPAISPVAAVPPVHLGMSQVKKESTNL